MEEEKADVIVIGGGASGMMAAQEAGRSGADVLLLEKNEKLGKKIYITGKGRCNFTNVCDPEEFFSHVPCGAKYLYSAVGRFPPRAALLWFEENGLKTVVERGNRAFPESGHASDVTKTLAGAMKKAHVKVRLNTEAAGILFDQKENRAGGVRLSDGSIIRSEAVIVCTGGLTYPSTGSTGDGYRFAREAGHSVSFCSPSLVPLSSPDEDLYEMQGLSLKNVALTFRSGGKEVWSGFGEMMFTHFGVTGPLVLTASSDLADLLRKHPSLQGSVDLKPALSQEELNRRILRDFQKTPNKEIRNVLSSLYPQKAIPVILKRSLILPDKAVHDITKAERRRLAENTKNFRFTVSGTRGYEEAVVTHGGVNVRELIPKSMESKKKKGLFFAGEVLDADAHTGGFNLQIAWSTGRAAGEAAAGYAKASQDYSRML